jgi:hypothetical protein
MDSLAQHWIDVKPEEEDPPVNYETFHQEKTARAPHTGRPFVNDRRTVRDIMSQISYARFRLTENWGTGIWENLHLC